MNQTGGMTGEIENIPPVLKSLYTKGFRKI